VGTGTLPVPTSLTPTTRGVTRDDVARAAGVSTAVVSYVLNNGPRPVSPSTRQRVEEAIRVLGYRPDARARSLKLGRTHALGVILPDASNPFFAELAHAVERAAARLGYALLICNTSNSPTDEERYLDDLAQRRVDGVILVSATTDRDLSPWARTSTPIVAMDRLPDESNVSTVRFAHDRGAALATRHLLTHGYRDIALVTGPAHLAVSAARSAGWNRATRRTGGQGRCVHAPFTFKGGYEATLNLLTGPTPPEAILASSDVQAIGVISAAAHLGVSIPDNLAIASIDGTPAAAYSNPELTTVRQPVERMASCAVTHLVEGDGIIHHTFTGRLLQRRSCGCPGTRLV
jgi:LacI family transcriptional regulator